MAKNIRIEVGRSFIGARSPYFLRRIVAVRGGDVDYEDYCLEGANAWKSVSTLSTCSTERLAQWAGREATEEEVSRLDTDATARRRLEEELRLRALALALCSDEELLAEVRRRGLWSPPGCS